MKEIENEARKGAFSLLLMEKNLFQLHVRGIKRPCGSSFGMSGSCTTQFFNYLK